MTDFRAVLLLISYLLAVDQQPRDHRPTVGPVGVAAISGVVVTEEREPKPLRRARVTLTAAAIPMGRTTITGDDGAFSFERLPAGRYTLTASKDGYVTMNFGARRPATPGARIDVHDEKRRVVTMRIPRGGVITGIVTTDDGQPLAAVSVAALAPRFNPFTGARHPTRAGSPAVTTTDDRGVYRLYGLPPGQYAVGVYVGPGREQAIMGGDLQVVSRADVRNALSALRQNAGAASPGVIPDPKASPTEAVPRRAVTLAPVYFPGTPMMTHAAVLKVAAGEERSGIDFSVPFVPVSKVEGFVSPPEAAAIAFLPDTGATGLEQPRFVRAGTDGRFSVSGLPPGLYTVVATTTRPATDGLRTPVSGTARVAVNGDDIAGVTIQLQPGLTLSGRTVFEGAEQRAIDLTRRHFYLPAATVPGTGMTMGDTSPEFQPDGRFILRGIAPGPYRPVGFLRWVHAPMGRWWLKSITLGGREVLDAPLEFNENRDDVVVTFTDRPAEVHGTVRNADDSNPAAGYVVVFSADRSHWFLSSRRVTGVEPGEDGRYAIRNLPPGDYLIVATRDVERDEWRDPEVLDQLAARAARITIAADKQTVDLTWAK